MVFQFSFAELGGKRSQRRSQEQMKEMDTKKEKSPQRDRRRGCLTLVIVKYVKD